MQPIDFLQELQQKYDRFYEKFQPVKIKLVFNQPVFTPGDTAFFSAWYLDESLLPVKGDHVVTLQLLDGDGSSVQKILFKVQNGRGSNQMILSKDLLPGNFKFVAYTDWMKNLGEAWFYKRTIQVVARKQLFVKEREDNLVRFYPEGGKLIAELSNKIAVTGPPLAALIIRTGHDPEAATVSLDSAGFGTFLITPAKDKHYFAESAVPGKNWPLPEAEGDGVGVRLESGDPFDLLFSVPTGSKWVDKEIFAVVNSNGKIRLKQPLVIRGDQAFRLPVALQDKSEALHQLFVFDAEGNVLAQRVFMPYSTRRAAVKMQFPSVVNQRENVSGTIVVSDQSGNPLESDFSMTVIQDRLFGPNANQCDFQLDDLPSVAERAEKLGPRHLSTLNDFLITQEWKRIKWQEVLADKLPEIRYPFRTQNRLRGHVVSKAGLPPPDSTVVIGYLQNNTMGYEGYTKDGKFEIPFVFDPWGDDHIFCTLQYHSKSIDNNYDIIISNDSTKITDSWSSSESAASSAYGEYAFNKRLVAGSYSFFGSGQPLVSPRDQNPNLILEDEFLGADYTVKVGDFVVFPTMEDLLREVVPFVQYRKKGSQQGIRMFFRYPTVTKISNDDPLYVIDGVMSKNTAYFMDMKPENLLSLKILNDPNKLPQLGKLGENGVIFIESKKRDTSNPLTRQNHFPIVGISRALNFRMGNTAGDQGARAPDLRSTLFWNPSLKSDASGRKEVIFPASDDVGPVRVLVRGITKDGHAFSAEQTINILFSRAEK